MSKRKIVLCGCGGITDWNCDWRIIGEKGTLLWNGQSAIQVELVEEAQGFHSRMRREEVPVPKLPPDKSGHAGLINEFLRCVDEGGEPETVGHDNFHSLAMVFAAIESSEAGQKVAVPGE